MKLLMTIMLSIFLWWFFAVCKEFRKRYCEHESDAFDFYWHILWIFIIGAMFVMGVLYLFDKSVCICAAS